MALRVRIKLRDVVQIGDVLVGVDDRGSKLALLVDAPRKKTVSIHRNDDGRTIGELMAEIRNGGTRPTDDGASDREDRKKAG